MKKRNNHYTFMFYPEGKGNAFTLRIHRYTLYLTIVSVVLIIAGLAVLIYKTGEIALKLQLVQGLKEENVRLKAYNQDLQIAADKIENIDSMAAYLYRLSNIESARGAATGRTPGAPTATLPAAAGTQPITKVEIAQAGEEHAAPRIVSEGEVFAASVPNIMPVDGWITKHFSDNPETRHIGMDIAAAHGTPIRATAMGVVENISTDRHYGLSVEVRHENGFVTRYSHCAQVLVSEGDRVNRGQTIALVGNTGRSTAPHLHYEVMHYGKYVDPMNFIGSQKQ